MKFKSIILLLMFVTPVIFAQVSTWKIFTNSEIGIQSSSISCIAEDKEFNIWIGTIGEGVFRYNWDTWANFNTDNSSLPSNWVTSIAVDSNNVKWIGTFGGVGGLTKFDDNSWKVYNLDEHGISGNTIYDIKIDKNGTFWMGSYWQGLIEFDGDTTFFLYNSSNTNLNPLREEIIYVNVELDSVILCGTELGGAASFNITSTTWTEYFSPVVPIDLTVNSIIIDRKKNIWFAGIQYVSMMDSNLNWSVFDYDAINEHDYYHDIVLLKNNNLLFSTSHGLLELNYLDGEVWTNIKPPALELDSIGCHGLAKDHLGNIWIGFYNGYLAIYNPDGITDVKRTQNSFQVKYSLSQNYPNPFNPSTTITYSIPKRGFVQLKIYDVLGEEIATLVNEEKRQGRYSVKFNGTNLPSGVYFYTLRVNNLVQSRKMILLR